jgi:cytochrome c5
MRTKRVISVSLSALLVFLGLSFLAGPATSAMSQAKEKALFEKKCSICHALSRPLGEHKSRAEWTKTVAQMRTNGCPINDSEAKEIVHYLSKIRGEKK